MWSMVAQRLNQITSSAATPDQLWQRVGAAWSAAPQEHIQSLFESMPRCVTEDEVEKLAYQLNEEAERTERPIRRLSKVMYGSTCADMQVDVMGSIKHVVGEQLYGGSVVVVHEEPHPQMTGTLSYRPEETGSRHLTNR
ncbi:hypothetical protein TNCV_1646801 [Trichonephila clavipes]|nr:hypothetical protein TNCV_1646801 [Trichonephila clavipes]